ncbi:hypothetical protein J520_0308 [Acinetobacter sp. 869535]|uniref:hypothetical protein n=1 Tax=Acinetobacter sp. 869535 TaxID=1310621 RepID=UPI0004455BFC|nr:hypothetical protein [Acinetobacter sp. 869535]EXC34416.1 hypothetical protein J520_0308 [Acinetobacter sp. 869535]
MDIENFIAEFKKTFVYDILSQTLSDEQLFEHVVDGDAVLWFKEQTRQMWLMWEKAQAVPEVAQRQGGYYIRDLRSQPGNCMKFWYQAGYGTKHKNFFWCATLEEAKEYKGGCDWFEIWHAPYIDSLVEYTVDFQLADRGVGLVDLKAQEPTND